MEESTGNHNELPNCQYGKAAKYRFLKIQDCNAITSNFPYERQHEGLQCIFSLKNRKNYL